MALRSLGLCAGIGGLELGLARWCKPVCLVERDAFAAACLVEGMEQAELDQAPIHDDLRHFDGRRWRGAVDLITAGYPCQPFSYAGKRNGHADERHLWPEVYRILQECDAPLLFCENVRGHLSLGFADVLADLAAIGFDAEWVCVRASDVGAPHERDRLFFLAYSNERGRESVRLCGLLDGERQVRRDDADGCHEGVAHPDFPRLEERQPRAEPRALPSAWPPGPDDADGWREYLASGGPAPTQPAVRRGSARAAVLVDSLRCLGNAVCPPQAEAAFEELVRRIA